MRYVLLVQVLDTLHTTASICSTWPVEAGVRTSTTWRKTSKIPDRVHLLILAVYVLCADGMMRIVFSPSHSMISHGMVWFRRHGSRCSRRYIAAS